LVRSDSLAQPFSPRKIHNPNGSCGCASKAAFEAIIEDRVSHVSRTRQIQIWAAAQKDKPISFVAATFKIDEYTARKIIQLIDKEVKGLWKMSTIFRWFWGLYRPTVEKGGFCRTPGLFTWAEIGKVSVPPEDRFGAIPVQEQIKAAFSYLHLLRPFHFAGIDDFRLRKLWDTATWVRQTCDRTQAEIRHWKKGAIRRSVAERAKKRAGELYMAQGLALLPDGNASVVLPHAMAY
jgi:hypothetical protein